MNRLKSILAIVAVLLVYNSMVFAQVAEHVPDEIIVKFKSGVSDSDINRINQGQGVSVKRYSQLGKFHILNIPLGRTVAEMASVYSRNPNVEYAEANYIAHAHMIPNDPLYNPYQWHLTNIGMEEAWELSTGSNITVAVVDTGVAYENYQQQIPIAGGRRFKTVTYEQAPDLAGTNFVPGYDFVNDDSHPNDDEGHGTHVTGTIAQTTNNSLGCAGVAYRASIMPVKVLNSSGSGTYADIADGIKYAADNGAKIINMSLGGSASDSTLSGAVSYAAGKGVLIICSSGNNGSSTTISFPAAYPETIAVGATRYDETVSYYSNCGNLLDFTAPGGDINVDQNYDGYGDGVLQQTFGTSPTDWGYYFYQGTSMAAPHVSGVAALILSLDNSANVYDVLKNTAKDMGDPGKDSEYGWGIIDAAAAVASVVITNPSAPTAAFTADSTSGVAPLTVNFTNQSIGATSLSWDFGDQSVKSSSENPTHTYNTQGNYTVTLTATNDYGSRTASATITVTPSSITQIKVAQNTVFATWRKAGKNIFVQGTTTIEIKTLNDVPVINAVVTGFWGGDLAAAGEVIGITNGTGTVVFITEELKIKNPAGSVTFTITSVSAPGFDEWNPYFPVGQPIKGIYPTE